MAGIDNIQSEILQEAQAAADALIEDARADAKKLAAESAEELDAIRRLAEGDSERRDRFAWRRGRRCSEDRKSFAENRMRSQA